MITLKGVDNVLKEYHEKDSYNKIERDALRFNMYDTNIREQRGIEEGYLEKAVRELKGEITFKSNVLQETKEFYLKSKTQGFQDYQQMESEDLMDLVLSKYEK